MCAVGCVGGGYEGQCGISFLGIWVKSKSRKVVCSNKEIERNVAIPSKRKRKKGCNKG